MDWEAKFMELQRHLDKVVMPLLESALRFVPGDYEESTSAYEFCRAPMTVDLPNIMTMCTPAERAVLVSRANEKLTADHQWLGSWTGKPTRDKPKGARPSLQMVTDFGREQNRNGSKRRKRVHASGNSGTNATTFPVSHVLLIGDGRYPTEERNYASHICHQGTCLILDHIIWEGAGANLRRERLCRANDRCLCGLQPPCNFELHK